MTFEVGDLVHHVDGRFHRRFPIVSIEPSPLIRTAGEGREYLIGIRLKYDVNVWLFNEVDLVLDGEYSFYKQLENL